MPDADINLHPDLIDLVDGDVSIARVLTVLGKLVARSGLEVFNTASSLVFEVDETSGNGTFHKILTVVGKLVAQAGIEVHTTGSGQAVDVDETTGVADFFKKVIARSVLEVGSSSAHGNVVIQDSTGTTRIDLRGGGGDVLVYRGDGTLAAKLSDGGMELFDSNGDRTADFSPSGTHGLYKDLNMNIDSDGYYTDIKLDGAYVGSRLTDLENRVDTLEGYH